jgi:hypothetical protein
MQTKEGWSVELKSIATHNLGDSVRPIKKWMKLLMGPDEMWYPVFIMTLLVLSIGFLQNLLYLLVDVQNMLNEYGGFFDHRLIRGRVCLCGGKRK